MISGNKPNISLVAPYSFSECGEYPIGLLLLASVVDDVANVKLNYLPKNEHGSSPELSYHEMVSQLVDSSTDVVGFSTLCTTFPRTLLIAKACKEANPDIIVALGGCHVSTVVDHNLEQHDFIDVIFEGEGEVSFREFCLKLKAGRAWHGIRGLSSRQGDRVIRNQASDPFEDLDALPYLDLSLLPEGKKITHIEVGRGCPFNCSYCSTSAFFNRQFRMKSPRRIIEEMLQLNQHFGIADFSFTHDNMTFNKPYMTAFCEELLNENMELRWGCSSRGDSLDYALIDLMHDAGCREIYIGFETASQRLQKDIRKNINVEQATDIALYASNKGVKITASFIIGFPDETEEEMLETLRLATRLRTANDNIKFVQLHMLTPLPGSALFEQLRSDIKFDDIFNDFSMLNGLETGEYELIVSDKINHPNFYYYPNPDLNRSRMKLLNVFFEFSYSFRYSLRFISEELQHETHQRLYELTNSPALSAHHESLASEYDRMIVATIMLHNLAIGRDTESIALEMIRFEAIKAHLRKTHTLEEGAFLVVDFKCDVLTMINDFKELGRMSNSLKSNEGTISIVFQHADGKVGIMLLPEALKPFYSSSSQTISCPNEFPFNSALTTKL